MLGGSAGWVALRACCHQAQGVSMGKQCASKNNGFDLGPARTRAESLAHASAGMSYGAA